VLHELSAKMGFCRTGLTPEDLAPTLSAREIADMVLTAESLDPVINTKLRDGVERLVSDWLFDAHGRGSRSGLPR
jgi:hypothetical protein